MTLLHENIYYYIHILTGSAGTRPHHRCIQHSLSGTAAATSNQSNTLPTGHHKGQLRHSLLFLDHQPIIL